MTTQRRATLFKWGKWLSLPLLLTLLGSARNAVSDYATTKEQVKETSRRIDEVHTDIQKIRDDQRQILVLLLQLRPSQAITDPDLPRSKNLP